MNINRRTMLGAAAILTASAATAAPAGAAIRKSGGGRAHGKALEKLQAYAEQHRADWGLPGMTVCVVDKEGFTGFVTSGLANIDKKVPVGPDHLFQIGSISKMFAALTLWSIFEEGKLSPETPLVDALPGLKVKDGAAIQLQHVLDHTSGLPGDAPVVSELGLWSGYAPGSHWSYSNTGYELLGLIIANADGRTYPESVAARVLEPLGMDQSIGAMRVFDRDRYATGYEPAYSDRASLRPGPLAPAPWVDSDSAAGCIAATAGDMTKFMQFLLGLAEGKGGPVLSDAGAVKFLANPADAPGWSPGVKYGNGIARVDIDGRPFLHHTGGMVSFVSSLHVDTETGVAAFSSANIGYPSGYRPKDMTIFACKLMHAMKSNGEEPEPKETKPTVENPERFSGVFTAANGDKIEIAAGKDSLALRRGGVESRMQPVVETGFACEAPEFAVTGLVFDLEEDKAVRVWAGEVEYAADPSAGFKPPAPADLSALAGVYQSDDAWSGPISLYARDGALWVGNVEQLVRSPSGEWGFGDESSPEKLRFDGVLAGRPHRLLLSGFPYYRRFS